MIIAENIFKKYGELPVLRGVSLTLAPGEVVALVGSSGAGKSTLLQILGTLDTPDSGKIVFEQQEVHTLNNKDQAAFRNRSLGFIFQFHHLLPEFTALENVCMPALIGGMSMQTAEIRAKELLERLGVSHRLTHKPTQLSGGEQQRVSVARALMNQPKLVLADEPTGNLDTQNSQDMYKLFFEISRTMGVSFLIATHNTELAQVSDRILRIQDGVFVGG